MQVVRASIALEVNNAVNSVLVYNKYVCICIDNNVISMSVNNVYVWIYHVIKYTCRRLLVVDAQVDSTAMQLPSIPVKEEQDEQNFST